MKPSPTKLEVLVEAASQKSYSNNNNNKLMIPVANATSTTLRVLN